MPQDTTLRTNVRPVPAARDADDKFKELSNDLPRPGHYGVTQSAPCITVAVGIRRKCVTGYCMETHGDFRAHSGRFASLCASHVVAGLVPATTIFLLGAFRSGEKPSRCRWAVSPPTNSGVSPTADRADEQQRDLACYAGFGRYFRDLSSVLVHSVSVSLTAPINLLVNMDAVSGSVVTPM
jgi:hypothetical protein